MKHQSDVLALFSSLASIPSPPGSEREVADRVGGYLRDLALDADEDDAGRRIGSNAGNMLCRIRRPRPTAAPRSSSAPTSTPSRRRPIEPVVEDGVVRNGGGTILGADNKAAVARHARGGPARPGREPPARRHRALFTPREEVGLQGAYAFDHTRLHASIGFVFDQGRRSATRPRRAVADDAVRALPRTGGARRDGPRRGARRSRPRRARSRT